MECYVGMDVHSKASVFVIQDGYGQVLAQGEMPTTREGSVMCYETPEPMPDRLTPAHAAILALLD